MRLDGWKSIAAYFNRERTTVIRWSAERGLPVHRIPGKDRGSVYALTEELDAWLEASRGSGPRQDEATADRPPVPSPPDRVSPGRAWRWVGAAALAAALLGLAAYAVRDALPRPESRVPRDANAAAMFVEARSDWAQRTEESILAAIGKLQRVVTIEPDSPRPIRPWRIPICWRGSLARYPI